MSFFKSIKFRLTAWYLTVIVVLLLIFSTAAYFMVSSNLKQNLDNSLKSRADEIQSILVIGGERAVFIENLGEVVLIYGSNSNLLNRIGPNIQITGADTFIRQVLAGQSSFYTAATGGGQQVRLYGIPLNIRPNLRIALIVGRPLGNITDALVSFRRILVISGLAAVILAGIGGLILAGRVLRPVDRITRTARDIGESDLSRRIDVRSDDELGRLASTLNNMVERLEAAFNRQKRFTADASHELRTPLAIIQAESTLSLSKERSAAEYRKSLESISQESAYMSSLVGKLLFLARSDAGKETLNLEDVNLKHLLSELSQDVEVLARDKGLHLSLNPAEDLTIKGDKVKLRQLFLNILENAVRYTPSGGAIAESLTGKDGAAVVAIMDTGIGIPAEHLPHIFERFYRVDKARSRAEGGTGLGLAIAKYIAEAHNGKIEVESVPGKGSTFRVIIPLSDH